MVPTLPPRSILTSRWEHICVPRPPQVELEPHPKSLARTGVQPELISQKMPAMFFLIRKWKIITCVLKIKYGPSEIWNASENMVFGSSFLWLETDQNIGSGFGLQSFFFLKTSQLSGFLRCILTEGEYWLCLCRPLHNIYHLCVFSSNQVQALECVLNTTEANFWLSECVCAQDR